MPASKNVKGLFCLRPFTNIDITYYKMTSCCCESWLPNFNAGDLEKYTLSEIWNSGIMRRIRKSILDGRYDLCSKQRCPYLQSDDSRLYTRDELRSVVEADEKGIDPEPQLLHIKQFAPWIREILDGKTHLDILPANYNLCYDESCNLRCPSCRKTNKVHTHGEEYDRRLLIHKKLFEEIEKHGYENVRSFTVTGAGDPFCSKIYQDLLFNFDGRKYPLLKFIIMTNGVLLTPEAWEKMNKIHKNIEYIFISVDAATPGTYEKIRVNGDFEKLKNNIEFLGQKRLEKKLNCLVTALIVQKKNYKEMPEFIEFCKTNNVDLTNFSTLDDWESWELDEYLENAVCRPDHPEYPELLEVLKDPIFDDPIVNLGNVSIHRNRALESSCSCIYMERNKSLTL
ncbi:MAG TPA: radical SAM protein [Clostridia bacterium]